VHKGRICALEEELNRFIIHENETPQEMFNRLNKMVNKIRALRGGKWSDKCWCFTAKPTKGYHRGGEL
jgi:hypothetical protein